MIYQINSVHNASKILPWIVKNSWNGIVFGWYDTETIHYGSQDQILYTDHSNYYNLFNRKGGPIVASPEDFYIISFMPYESEHIIVDNFIKFLLENKKIILQNNDLVINNHKVAGSVKGSYKNQIYYAWHFSVKSVNINLIQEICHKKSNKTPSCFFSEGFDFKKIFYDFLKKQEIIVDNWNINIPDEYISNNIILPKTEKQTSLTTNIIEVL